MEKRLTAAGNTKAAVAEVSHSPSAISLAQSNAFFPACISVCLIRSGPMQISSAEAYDLLSQYVREHRRVRCIFQAPWTHMGFSSFLWEITEAVLTLKRLPSPEAARDIHVPLEDAEFAVSAPAETPEDLRPEAPLDRFDRVLEVEQVRFLENGEPVKMRWAVWIAARHSWADDI